MVDLFIKLNAFSEEQNQIPYGIVDSHPYQVVVKCLEDVRQQIPHLTLC